MPGEILSHALSSTSSGSVQCRQCRQRSHATALVGTALVSGRILADARRRDPGQSRMRNAPISPAPAWPAAFPHLRKCSPAEHCIFALAGAGRARLCRRVCVSGGGGRPAPSAVRLRCCHSTANSMRTIPQPNRSLVLPRRRVTVSDRWLVLCANADLA
jgi:hypothetical protein